MAQVIEKKYNAWNARESTPVQAVTIDSEGTKKHDGESKSAHSISQRFSNEKEFTTELKEDVLE